MTPLSAEHERQHQAAREAAAEAEFRASVRRMMQAVNQCAAEGMREIEQAREVDATSQTVDTRVAAGGHGASSRGRVLRFTTPRKEYESCPS